MTDDYIPESIPVYTGITFGLCLCIITCFAWRGCLKCRLHCIGKSTRAKVEKVQKNISYQIANDSTNLWEKVTSYDMTFSYKIIITEQSLRYVLQQMAKAYNVHLPVDIINLCLEYVANSFIIYYAISCKQSLSKAKWARTHSGQTFYVRYDPKYPKWNDVTSPGYFSIMICCSFIWFVIGLVVVFQMFNDNQLIVSYRMVWITCITMISVVFITVCCICLIMPRYKLKQSQELQCEKILDRNNNDQTLEMRNIRNNYNTFGHGDDDATLGDAMEMRIDGRCLLGMYDKQQYS